VRMMPTETTVDDWGSRRTLDEAKKLLELVDSSRERGRTVCLGHGPGYGKSCENSQDWEND
jgi:hypothetical protein